MTSRIRGLELLFNLEKNNFKSKEDCVVAVFHCLLINENFPCVGIGDEWAESDSTSTELLPSNWNTNQDVYSLRYASKDGKTRILLKFTKMEHILQVDAVKNEKTIANVSVVTENYISDDFNNYSTAYKDLDSLSESFQKGIMQKLQEEEKKPTAKPSKVMPLQDRTLPSPPERPPTYLEDRDPLAHPVFPRVGERDLNPFGSGVGGMFMDPSSFGVPSRPSLPDFGVGGPGGLPRGAVPPGARFDPFMPPIHQDQRKRPHPDSFNPPDFDDFM